MRPSASTRRTSVSPLSAMREREAELAREVEDPAGDLLGVLPEEGPLAGRDLHPVEVVPGGVAVVEADEDDVGVGLRDVVDLGARPLGGGQVAGGGSVLAGLGRRSRVDGPDVEVLVAVLVLDEEDVLAVAAPEEAGHRALRLGRDEAGLVVGVARLLDPDVAGLLPGLQEGGPLPVGGELGAGDLGVAEEELAVEDGGKALRGRGLRPAGAGFAGAAAGVWADAAIGTARAETRTSRARRGWNDERVIFEASLPVGECGITLMGMYVARARKFPREVETGSPRRGT